MINFEIHNFYSRKKRQMYKLHNIVFRLYSVQISILNSQYYTFNSHIKVENILNSIKINLINVTMFNVTPFTYHNLNILIPNFTLYYWKEISKNIIYL